MPVYKIAIAGASSLVGRELKEVLSESPLASSTFSLFDEADAQGQLDQVGDEVTFIQPINTDSFDQTDFTFFCGSESLTRRHWQQALRAGSTVLDLTAALDREAGVVVRAPWLARKRRLLIFSRRQWCQPTLPSSRWRCCSNVCSRPLRCALPPPR